MIAARTLKSKEAIEDLTDAGEDMEDIEIAASNAEKALNSIGLSARDSNNDFKDLEVILGEVAAKWDTLSDATKQYVSEQMAGNNRRSFFIGLMENYTRTMELQQLAESSSGQLMEASEKKAQSLEGRLNVLQNSWNKLYEAMLNSSAMKSWIDFGTDSLNVIAKLVEAMNGKWIPAITGAIGYMITFRKVLSGVSWTEFIGNCIVSAGKLLGLKASADAATVSVTLLKAGLKGLVVGGIIATIAAIAMSFKSLDERTEKATESLENYIAVMDETDSQVQAVEMMELKIKKINSANTSLEYQEKLIKEVNAELSKHGEAYGDIKAILDNENLSLEYRLELLDQEIQKRREIAEQTARDAFDDTDWGNDVYDKQRKEAGTKFDILSQSYEDVNFTGGDTTEFEKNWIRVVGEINKSYQEGVEQFNEIRKAYAQELISTEEYEQAYKDFMEFETYYTEQVAKIEQETGRTVEFATQSFAAIHKDATDTISASQEDYLNKLGQLEDSQQLLADILDEGASRSELMQLLENETFSDFQGDIRNTSEVVEYLTNKVSNLQTEVDSVDTTKFSDLNDSINNVNGEASTMSIKEANEEYIKQLNTINDIKDLLDSITENGYTLDIATDALDSGFLDDFTGSIDDASAVQDHLNQKIAEAQQIANTAYYNMMKDDENFWNAKMKNSEAWKTHEQQMQNEIVKLTAKALGIQETDFANFIDTKGGFRQVDYSNANTMAQAENNLQSNLMSQITNYVAQMTNNKAGYRQTDMSNVVQFLNTQGAKEAKTVQELINLWAKFYNAKKKAIQAEINDYNKRTQELMKSTGAMMEEEAWLEDGALKHGILNATKQLTDLELSNTAMTNYFEGISAWFNGVSGGLGQNYVGGKGVGGGGLSSGKPSTSTTGSGSRPSSGSGSGGSGSGSGSGSEKTVEDMELEIDRYYALQDAIENVNKALAKNQALQENVRTKAEYKKLIEEEINLTNQKIKALENLRREQERERDELKASLKSNGFTFDGNNNITNYANRLRQLQNWANGITNPDQKEAAIAQVNAIKEMVDKYTELEDSTIPSTTEEINGLKNEIISINKEFKENMKLIDALGDRYFDVLRKIAKVENELALNQAKQDNANDYERIDLLGKEIELLLKRQQLVKEQRNEANKEASELKNQLVGKGVKFDNNGSITNYKALVKSLEDKANGLVGDAQDEAVENAQEILDLIEKYVTLTEDTLPSLETEWEKYTTQIQDSKDAIEEIFRSFKQTVTDVQKDIASAYEKYQTERYNKLQESLDKEIELYNKAYDEENFNRDLSKQQRELEEIAQQIAIYSRDTSEAGKARLEQLRKEYEEQQQAINDMIRDKEKDNASDRFDEVAESLDKELEDLLAPEKLVATVNDAIANGMITIGEETMKLDDLMTTWLNDTGDGLYALGDILKSELVENLEKAQDIIGKMNVNGFTMKAPTTTNEKLQSEIDKLKNTSVTGDMNFSLVVQGDVTKDSMPKLEKELQNMENRIYANIAKSLK